MSKPRDTRDRTPQILTKVPQRRHAQLTINLKSTQGLYMTTVNPCNDFLIDFLIASKLKAERQGIGKHTTYNLAIQSVRKYPLPIVCQAQLAALQGFGDFFINEAAKRIQKHYKRGRLPTPQQIIQDDNQHFEALQANRRKGYNKKKKNFSQLIMENKSVQQKTENSPKQSQTIEKQQTSQSQQSCKPQQTFQTGTKQTKSKKKQRDYTPRGGSQSEKILKSLYMMNAQYFYANKGQINQTLFQYFKEDNVTSWQSCRGQLKTSGYVKFDMKDQGRTKLTKKGYNFIAQRMGDQLDKLFTNANVSVLKITKRNFVEIQKRTKMIFCQNPNNITVVVNKHKDEVNEQQMQIIISQLECKGIKVKEEMLEEGTFMWEIDGKLIDLTINRFNFHDLAIPLISDQKKRIINSSLIKFFTFGTKIHIIIQKHKQNEQSQGRINLDEYDQQKITLSHIKRFEMNCRLSGYKIIKLRSLKQTIIYLSEITWILRQRLRKLRETKGTMDMLESIIQYNEQLARRKMVITFYYKFISRFPGISIKAAQILTKKFGTFKITHQKLQQLYEDDESRVKLLQDLLLSSEVVVRREELQQFINFFFATSY